MSAGDQQFIGCLRSVHLGFGIPSVRFHQRLGIAHTSSKVEAGAAKPGASGRQGSLGSSIPVYRRLQVRDRLQCLQTDESHQPFSLGLDTNELRLRLFLLSVERWKREVLA